MVSLEGDLGMKKEHLGENSEIQIKSRVYLIVMQQCWFLGIDKCTIAI